MPGPCLHKSSQNPKEGESPTWTPTIWGSPPGRPEPHKQGMGGGEAVFKGVLYPQKNKALQCTGKVGGLIFHGGKLMARRSPTQTQLRVLALGRVSGCTQSQHPPHVGKVQGTPQARCQPALEPQDFRVSKWEQTQPVGGSLPQQQILGPSS